MPGTPRTTQPKIKPALLKILLLIGPVTFLCLSFLAGFETQRRREAAKFSAQPYPFGVFWEAWGLIDEFFYGGPPPPQVRTYSAVRETLALLNDPYTVIVTGSVSAGRVITTRIITGQIGYIAVEEITPGAGPQAIAAVEKLQTANAQALILDLRGTTGGYLTATLTILGCFLDNGTALYTVNRHGLEQMFPVPDNGPASGLPLRVLIDGKTAGAAEAVAGTLQERKRAELVGEATAGLGTAQTTYRLSDGSTLYLTTAALLTAEHNTIRGTGVAPDLTVDTDNALKAALGP